MMKSNHRYLLHLAALIAFSPAIWAGQLISADCPVLEEIQDYLSKPVKNGSGILWKISGPVRSENYLFGTIHVSDERIVDVPEPVSQALEESELFIMEALPELEAAAVFSNMMFFQDGSRLENLISPPVYEKTVDILKRYMIPEQVVTIMKPWAAYVTMNYPPQSGAVLDLELMARATLNGSEIRGLETMTEQGEIFNKLPVPAQVRLLTDTVCHYDTVIDNIEEMKEYYLKRDTGGLYNLTNRYSIRDDAVYRDLMNDLLTRRNHNMADRMQVFLKQGNAFIAIGALHLPGEDGVLNLLKVRGYNITRIY